MFYLGIDVAKSTHYASIMDSDGVIIINPFPFQNNISGFLKLISKIESKSIKKNDLLIGLESTSHYGENLIAFLYNKSFKVAIINPIQTAAIRKSSIRKTKTDKIDTFVIIKSLRVNDYNLVSNRDINLLKLKSLVKARQNIVTLRSRSKIQLVSYVDQFFPELHSFFKSGIHINVSYELLKTHSNPKDIKELHLTYLTNLLSKASRGKYTKPEALALKSLAAESVGIDNPILSLQISQSIDQIRLFDSQIKDIEDSIKDIILKRILL
jgi:transposase